VLLIFITVGLIISGAISFYQLRQHQGSGTVTNRRVKDFFLAIISASTVTAVATLVGAISMLILTRALEEASHRLRLEILLVRHMP
jgi:hypothetical protein